MNNWYNDRATMRTNADVIVNIYQKMKAWYIDLLQTNCTIICITQKLVLNCKAINYACFEKYQEVLILVIPYKVSNLQHFSVYTQCVSECPILFWETQTLFRKKSISAHVCSVLHSFLEVFDIFGKIWR